MASSFCTAAGAISGWSGQTVTGRGERLRLALGGTAAVSLAAHAFSYFNFIPQHDALIESFWANSDWQVTLGRFLLPAYMSLRGTMPMPWTAGLLSILFLGLSVYLFTATLDMDTRAEILLTGAFLSANITVTTLNALFQYFSDAFMFSLLLACLGTYLLRDRPGWRQAIPAAVCYFLCVGIYPAFITAALCTLLILLLRDAADADGFTAALWKKIGVWALVLAAALAMYLAASRAALSSHGLSAADKSTSVFALGGLSVRELLYRAGVNGYFFLCMLFVGFSPVHHVEYLGAAGGIAGAALAVLCVASFCCRNKGRIRGWIWVLFLAGAALFPVIARAVNIMTGNGSANQTIFSQYLAWPVLLWLLFYRKREPLETDESRQKPGRLSVAAAVLLSLVVILGNVRLANQAYTVQKVLYDRAVYHTGRVIEDLQEAGYEKDSADRVILAGTFDLGNDMTAQLDRLRCIGAFYDTAVTYDNTFRYLTRLMGYGISAAGADSAPDPEAMRAAIAAMPTYPARGYLQVVDGYYVIRLS